MYFGKSDASERALEIVPARDEQVQPGESERERERERKRQNCRRRHRESLFDLQSLIDRLFIDLV